MLVQAEDVATYEGTEKKVALNVRVPASTRDGLEAIVKLWRMYAAARGDEVDVIDLSYVMRRLLRVGVEQTFAEFGGRPTDEAAWRAVEAAIAKTIKKQR